MSNLDDIARAAKARDELAKMRAGNRVVVPNPFRSCRRVAIAVGAGLAVLIIVLWTLFPKRDGIPAALPSSAARDNSSDVRVDYREGDAGWPPTIEVTFLRQFSRAEMCDSLRAALEKWVELTPHRQEALAAAFNSAGDSLHIFYRYDPKTGRVSEFVSRGIRQAPAARNYNLDPLPYDPGALHDGALYQPDLRIDRNYWVWVGETLDANGQIIRGHWRRR